MNRWIRCIPAFAASAVMGATAGAATPTPPASAPQTDSPGVQAVRALALADQLAIYGLDNADPIALIEAAKIKKSVSTKPLEVKPTVLGNTGGSEAETPQRKMDADSLLAQAESMAAGNATIKALIADARAAKSRGAMFGARIASQWIPRGGSVTYVIPFNAGFPAAVTVTGTGSSNLDLFVYDGFGNLACADFRYGDQAFCNFMPILAGNFTVTVTNNGFRHNFYTLATN